MPAIANAADIATPADFERIERLRVRLTAGALLAGSNNAGAIHFGAVSSRLTVRSDTRIPTMATDGTCLYFNPAGCRAMPDDELLFTWAHEICHVILLHMYRKPDYLTWHEWNVATDYAINLMVDEMGIGKRPQGIYFDPKYRGLSAEQIAHALRKAQQSQPQPEPSQPSQPEPQDSDSDTDSDTDTDTDQDSEPEQADDSDSEQDSEQDSDSDSKPGDDADDADSEPGDGTEPGDSSEPGDSDGTESGNGSGDSDSESSEQAMPGGQDDGTLEPGDDCLPPMPEPTAGDATQAQTGEPMPEPITADDWQVTIEQAESLSRKAGTLPGTMERAIAQGRQYRADWKAVLRDYIETLVKSDHTWRTPNRRAQANGIRMPGTRKDNVPPMALAIDCSGSVTADDLADFADNARVILDEIRPRMLTVIYHDTRVTWVDHYTPDDASGLQFEAHGGGGTSFRPTLDAIQSLTDAGEMEPPAVLVWLTDCASYDLTPADEPSYPVIWARIPGSYDTQPFGQHIDMA